MRKPAAAAGTAAFFAVAPAVVAGVIPWLITGYQTRESWFSWLPARILGAAMVGTGAFVLIQAFTRFVTEGFGTPAPVAPTEHLVIGGLYRYVRNPMYLAVTVTIVGQALIFGQPVLLAYAALAWLVMAAFARWYEEPALARRFGTPYDTYRRAVPAWWPRRPRNIRNITP